MAVWFFKRYGTEDDDELTVYGVNSGTGEIFYNTSMVSLGFFGGEGRADGSFRNPVGIDAAGQVMPGGDGWEGACIVIETNCVMQTGSLHHPISISCHTVDAVMEPPRRSKPHGREVPGLVTATPLFREGEFAGTLAVFTDLTELKQMEQQLIQSGKLAAIGQLVAGVAHELNNPLTSVVGYSELLMAAECSEEIKRDLERINRQGLRAARIVENLLTFARRRAPRKEYININDVIERSLELQARQLEMDRISIVKELDEALPQGVADPFQMQQVFMNIIGNAHQSLRNWEGERQLRVRSKLAEDMIHLRFTDSGPGIPTEDLPLIFDRFYRVDRSRARAKNGGAGLGLAIARWIAQAHGGQLSVQSVEGQGATRHEGAADVSAHHGALDGVFDFQLHPRRLARGLADQRLLRRRRGRLRLAREDARGE